MNFKVFLVARHRKKLATPGRPYKLDVGTAGILLGLLIQDFECGNSHREERVHTASCTVVHFARQV